MLDLDQFNSTGVAHLPGAFAADQAEPMRELIWSFLEERSSIRRSDPARWPTGGIPAGMSLKALKTSPVFRPFSGNEALREGLDAIFGAGQWAAPRRMARILLTFPGPGPWVMPSGWHFDAGFNQPTFPVPWVQLWAFIDDVAPCGGGTLLLRGSHRLVERYSRALPPEHRGGNQTSWARFMSQDPSLERLYRGGNGDDSRELLGARADVGGIEVQAQELTGAPGDLFLTHGQVLHSAAPNTTTRVRMMLTGSIYPTTGRP